MTYVKIIDDMGPQDIAMLQALYSRDPASVDVHLADVESRGSSSFMSRYYVGYGHKSIGDCGTTTLFIENVSMLCAKAIQQWPLYSGQECSTRYLDFSKQEFLNPLGTEEGEAIQERWRRFYLDAMEPVKEHLRQKHPKDSSSHLRERVYDRAINARAFDILRGFLPAGAVTSLSWHTNLRQASDHLLGLTEHPDPLIAEVGEKILEQLLIRYPDSFGDWRAEEKEWSRLCGKGRYMAANAAQFENSIYRTMARYNDGSCVCDDGGLWLDQSDIEILKGRPKYGVVPRELEHRGLITTHALLDYGSYRDLQRHRNGYIGQPVLNRAFGFHPWYLEQLPDSVRSQAEALLESQETACVRQYTAERPHEHPFHQYYVPMGYRVPIWMTQSLPAWIYRVELRSQKTVHPTLRKMVHEEIQQFGESYPSIPLYCDLDPDDWDIRRGTQTIEKVSEQS